MIKEVVIPENTITNKLDSNRVTIVFKEPVGHLPSLYKDFLDWCNVTIVDIDGKKYKRNVEVNNSSGAVVFSYVKIS